MSRLSLILAFVALAAARTAHAEIGTMDTVPAATLLLPYFEVDLRDPTGADTLFSINNASATAVMAHVTLWTDESVPTLNFDVYLTGYDVQKIDLGDVFRAGNFPRTATAGQDPTDTISPKGFFSQDINFASCSGTFPYANPVLDAIELSHLRKAHTGRRSPTAGGCVSANHGDRIARGYVTVDTVNSCNTAFPSDGGYFANFATFQNVLWGDYSYESPSTKASSASPLVSIEACPAGFSSLVVGNGAGFCPFVNGNYTFYGRFNAFDGSDQREPLPTTFAARYIDGGLFSGGTDLVVWRDSKSGPVPAHNCATGSPSWFPLGQTEIVAFDEQEGPTELCAAANCFPLETQRVSVAAPPLSAPAPFGWLRLDLNHNVAGPLQGVSQSWVSVVHTANGQYTVGYQAIGLDSAITASPGGFTILPP